jgi:glycosyltransferase involved in cell wall biosynthesis
MPEIKIAYLTTVAVTQRYCLRGQNDYMRARGFQLHAISSGGKDLAALAERDPVSTHAIPLRRAISPIADLIALYKLILLLRDLHPEILHVSTPKAALLGSIAGWLCRIPVRIFLIRGLVSSGRAGFSGWLHLQLERLCARLTTQQICVSRSLLNYANEKGIIKADHGFVAACGMSNGVDPQWLGEGDAPLPRQLADFKKTNDIVIGFSGRLTRDKGIEELAQAWSVLREEFPAVKLLICGSYETGDPVDPHAVQRLQQDPRVMITGWLDKSALYSYYQQMDIFAFPSYREGFPNGPMEAAALALPVITTSAVGCVDAIVNNVTGRIVPPADAKALEQVLRDYIVSPQLRNEHGQNGRQRVLDNFRPELIWRDLFTEYRRLLREAGIDTAGLNDE